MESGEYNDRRRVGPLAHSGPISIRRSLLENLLGLVLALGAALLAATFLGSGRALRTLSVALMARSIDHTEAELRAFFAPVEETLSVARAWGEAGRLRLDAPEDLTALLGPVVAGSERISAAMLADEAGREHLLRRSAAGWLERRDRGGDEVLERRWAAGTPRPAEAGRRPLAYDPRERPWFRGALAARAAGRAVHWTEPYVFFASRRPGVTASAAFDAPGGAGARVVGFDVLLADLSAFTTGFAVSRRGTVFVLSDDDRLVAAPGAPVLPDARSRRGALLRDPAELGSRLLLDALAVARRHPRGAEGPWRFASGGEPWWLQTRAFPLGEQRWTIAVLVPEADLSGDLAAGRLVIVGLTLLFLGLAALQAVRLARRYSRPIEALVRESDRISRGDLEPTGPVPSPVEEIHRLADAHDRMRGALRALLRLERDVQVAREIQEGTFPSAMPALDGYELAAWAEPAEEAGGDTYDAVGLADAPGAIAAGGPARRALLLLADATGHGVGPALSAAQVRAMLRMAVRVGADLPSVVEHMNEQLCEDLTGGRFVTAWLGELDGVRHRLRSLAAGQAPVLHYVAAEGAVRVLGADAPPLGIRRELDGLAPRELCLGPGDRVAVLSDGVFDTSSPTGELFGEERVCRLLEAHAGLGAAAWLALLRDALAAFAAGVPARDDRTALVVARAVSR